MLTVDGLLGTPLHGIVLGETTVQDPETSGTFFSWYTSLIEYAEADGTKDLEERCVS